MTKPSEFREFEAGSLRNKLKEMEAEYFDLKFQATLSKLENVSLIKQKRRDIARIKTIIHQQESQKA